jgi:DNA-binding transcriptional MerR regulator
VAQGTERTIDELAQAAGTPSSTVRMYQSKGLLPPPRLVGRVGWYGEGHLARLRLIGRLQAQGFSLAAIRHLVDAWESGRGLPEVLGLEASIAAAAEAAAGVAGTGVASPALVLSLPLLAAVFEGVALTPEVMARAVELGLVELDDEAGVVRVPNPTFLRLGSEIARLGIPAEEVLDEYARLRDVMGEVADRFTDLFDRHLLAPVADEGYAPDRLPELAATFDRLRGLASQIVDAVLREAIAERATSRLAAEASRFAGRGRKGGDAPKRRRRG